MKKILTWIKPTWAGMHLWNYLWMFVPLIENIKWKESFFFIPDHHALTTVHDRKILESNRKRVLCETFALIPEDSNITVFEQSKVTHINNITWVISSVTPYSMMLRAHSFKDSQNKNSEINMATFNYPILMTSDIITYDIDLVPLWKDQKQHLEFARDIAQNFNKTYNTEFFKLPDWLISEEVWVIPGTDGRKMSKSYNNHIAIFDSPKDLKKKVMSIVTWSEGLEEPKDPDKCNVFNLIKFFASEEKTKEIREKYKAGNYWYWHAKLALLEILEDHFWEARKKYEYYMNNFSEIEKKLEIWNKKVDTMATAKYEKMLEIVWLWKIK